MFIYPIYNRNWRNISTIYIYITRLASNEIFSPSNKIHWEVGRAKDLSAPLYKPRTKVTGFLVLFLIIEGGTDSLSRNVGKKFPLKLRNNPEGRSSWQ